MKRVDVNNFYFRFTLSLKLPKGIVELFSSNESFFPEFLQYDDGFKQNETTGYKANICCSKKRIYDLSPKFLMVSFDKCTCIKKIEHLEPFFVTHFHQFIRKTTFKFSKFFSHFLKGNFSFCSRQVLEVFARWFKLNMRNFFHCFSHNAPPDKLFILQNTKFVKTSYRVNIVNRWNSEKVRKLFQVRKVKRGRQNMEKFNPEGTEGEGGEKK